MEEMKTERKEKSNRTGGKEGELERDIREGTIMEDRRKKDRLKF